jgi:hypothetical protein
MNRTAISDPTWTGPTRHPLGVGDVYRSGDLLAIASIEPTGAHISVSAPGRYPTWDEIASIKERAFPDVRMVMALPPRAEYVNLHQTCLHIWEATP